MINARQSEYLLGCKEKLEQLVDILKNEYDYVSVLATDVSGLSYAVNRKTSSINEFRDSERGFVVRVYCNGGYSEYSFNRLDDVNETAQQIITALNAQSSVLGTSAKLKTPLLEEEEACRSAIFDLAGQRAAHGSAGHQSGGRAGHTGQRDRLTLGHARQRTARVDRRGRRGRERGRGHPGDGQRQRQPEHALRPQRQRHRLSAQRHHGVRARHRGQLGAHQGQRPQRLRLFGLSEDGNHRRASGHA